MTPAVLRKWKMFTEWSDQQLEQVVLVNIFKTGNTSSADDLGGLVLTTDDEVFHLGHPHPVFGGRAKTKIDELSGLGLKKIEAGDVFCVMLSEDGKLYLMGSTRKNIPDSALVYYEQHDMCYNSLYPPDCVNCEKQGRVVGAGKAGVFELAGIKFKTYCTKYCRISIQPCCSTSVTNKNLVKLVKFKEAVVRCTKCHRLCTAYQLGDVLVNYCQFCNYLPQGAIYEEGLNCSTELEILNFEPNRISDVACGCSFFVALNTNNDLILWGLIAGSSYEGLIYNPNNVRVKSFSCGGNHVAVLSAQGDLYTCGLGDVGQLGYNWVPEMSYEVLRKVPLAGKVRKVCCGDSTTVCLMEDGSLMCFGSHMKIMQPMMLTGTINEVLVLNQKKDDFVAKPARVMLSKKFTDVVNSPLTNIYFVINDTYIMAWGRATDQSRQPKLVFGLGNQMADLPAKFTFKTPITCQSTISPHRDSELYGKKFLSDLTLKLSDGDFPAHRLVLLTNSAYFRNRFEGDDSDTELDMSNYNPEAYRCLLKYFYQLPPTNLNSTDLFDLYLLANGYKENNISQEVFAKLKANLNADTVLPLLRKAKEENCTELLEECNTCIQSHEFKHILAEKVSGNLDKALTFLEAFEN